MVLGLIHTVYTMGVFVWHRNAFPNGARVTAGNSLKKNLSLTPLLFIFVRLTYLQALILREQLHFHISALTHSDGAGTNLHALPH